MRQVAKTSRNFFGETFAVLGAALSVSAAVRAHRKPARADLEALERLAVIALGLQHPPRIAEQRAPDRAHRRPRRGLAPPTPP